MNKKIFAGAILVLAIAIIFANLWKPGTSNDSNQKAATGEETENIPGAKLSDLEEGSMAPDFELPTLTGEKIKLSDLRGKKVILNFWATWCPPCKAEMPHMQSYYEKNKDNGMTILSVNLTSMDKGRPAIEQFIKDYRLTFPIVLDEENFVGTKYQAFTIPTSYIIGTDGKIYKKFVGPMDENKMDALLKEAK